MASEMLTEQRGATLILTISDPATRNTLSPVLIGSGIDALAAAEHDAGIRSVVLQGAGSTFCAGGNLQGLAERRQAGREAQAEMLDRLNRWVKAMRAFPKPLIAAVEGVAAGAGFSLACACDLIVAGEGAKFVLSYGRIGLTPDGGATAHLLQALPRTLVQQWIWLCEPVPARQLLAHGVVNWVVPNGGALGEALAVAERLQGFAANAIAGAKQLLEQSAPCNLQEQLDAETQHFLSNLLHRNGGEGLQAFFDKRAPKFE